MRNIKVSFYRILFVFLGLILTFALFRFVLLEGKWATFDDTQKEFSINYPANWHVSTYTAGYRNWPELAVELEALGFFATNRMRILREETDHPSLIDTVAWSEELITRHNGNYISEPEWTAIGLHAYPAIKRTYTRLNRFHVTAYYFVTNNSMIALEFTTNFNQSDPEIKRTYAHMVGTFELHDEQ